MIEGWWAERTVRERVLLGVAGGLSVLVMLAFVIVGPIVNARADAADDYARAVRDLATAERAAAVIETARAEAAGREGDVRAIVANTAVQRGVSLSRVQPADDAVSVVIDAAASQRLYDWLVALETDYGVRVVRANVSRVDRTGLLRASITLSREAAA